MKTYSFFLALTLLFSFFMMDSVSIVHAADGDFVWAKAVGGGANDEGQNIFVDSSGNVYTTGYFEGTVDFDPGAGTFPLTSTGNADIFISKLDSSGSFVWARSIGGDGDDVGFGVFVDSAGYVYTTGYFQSPVDDVDFDPGVDSFLLASIGSTDIFISKLDSNGNFVGAWTMGGTSDDYGNGIFVDSLGNIYTTGYFKNTADFDPGAGTTNLTSNPADVEDIFISKLDNNGNFLWAKDIGGAAADVGLGLSLYSSGNVYITGWFQGTVDFGTTTLSSKSGTFDIFITKLDSGGDFIWAKGIGGALEDVGQAVSVDYFGNVYTTGWFNGTVDFDPGTGVSNLISSAGSPDIFISKLDSDGNFVWAKGMGGTFSDVGYGIFVDSSANVYTTGFFGGTADFDPGSGTAWLTSNGSEDIFISKLNSSGNFVWGKAMGGSSVDYGYDIFVDSSGNVYTTGFFQDTVDFDPGVETSDLSSNGFKDIFVSKLVGPDATFPWAMFLPAIMNHPQP
jgi:beta-propeller repeat-containing protein